MASLDHLKRPAANAFQAVYCTRCWAVVGIRAGGGSVSGGDTDADITEGLAKHLAWHDRLEGRA